MTTTVTTTTVTTTTALGLTTGLGVIATLVLLAFLFSKEIASASQNGTAVRWARTVNIGILPLLFVFVVIAATKVAEVL